MDTSETLALYSLGFFIIILLVRSWLKRRSEKKYWAKIHEKMHSDAYLYEEDDEVETSSSEAYEYFNESNYKRRDKPTNSDQQLAEFYRLTNCEACDDKISIEASSCPHCGHPTGNARHQVTTETDNVVSRTISQVQESEDVSFVFQCLKWAFILFIWYWAIKIFFICMIWIFKFTPFLAILIGGLFGG